MLPLPQSNIFYLKILLNIFGCFCKKRALLTLTNSVRPHRRQPTRLPRPRDSPGKNTEWVAISSSNAWKWKVKVKSLSRVQLLAILWTAAHQAPPSMGCGASVGCLMKYHGDLREPLVRRRGSQVSMPAASHCSGFSCGTAQAPGYSGFSTCGTCAQ